MNPSVEKLKRAIKRLPLARDYFAEEFISYERPHKRLMRRTFTHDKPSLVHFEFHVVDHCNLNCRFCNHFSNLSEEAIRAVDDIRTDLEDMAALFETVEQIFILGGEPMLHPRIAEIVSLTRALFPASRIILISNGLLAPRMDESFWTALRESDVSLSLTRYPVAFDYDQVVALSAEHEVDCEFFNDVTETGFRYFPLDIAPIHDAEISFRACRKLSVCPLVRDGRIYPCGFTAYSALLADALSIDGLRAGPDDSISIRGEYSGEQIIDFLRSPVPYCGHCAVSQAYLRPWESEKLDPADWLTPTSRQRYAVQRFFES